MTSKADRSELSRALAKAIAYHDCGKSDKARVWAARLAQLLDARGILRPEFADIMPE